MRHLSFLLTMIVFSQPGVAQTIRGHVLDSVTSSPVDRAHIELRPLAGHSVGTTASDTSGAFALRAPAPGSYQVHVRRLGYAPFTSPVGSLTTATDTTIDIRLTSLVVALPAISVTAEEV